MIAVQKRNLILWNIAQHLAKFKDRVGTVEWRYHNGDPFRPALILTHPTLQDQQKKKSKKRKKNDGEGDSWSVPRKTKFRVEVVMAMESIEWVPSTRFFPHRSNLGAKVIQTPAYNARLAQEAVHDVDALVDELDVPLETLRETTVLLKIWCLQRGFLRNNETGWTETSILFQLAFLYRTKRAQSRMAPLQVMTAFMKFWSTALQEGEASFCAVMPLEGQTEGQTVQSCSQAKLYRDQWPDESKSDAALPKTLLKCFQQRSNCPVVLLDSTMKCNLLQQLTKSMAQGIANQAQNTLDCLHSTRDYTHLFLHNARFWNYYDAYMKVPLSFIDWKRIGNSKDWGPVNTLSRKLVSLLTAALGDRVHNIGVLGTGNRHSTNGSGGDADQIPTFALETTSSSRQRLTSSTGRDHLVLGVRINTDTSFRMVDRGPPADDTGGVEEFLKLWGSAAQLRRFKDGAIVQAVAWNEPDQDADKEYIVFDGDDRTQGGIVERIIRYILKTHFFVKKGSKRKDSSQPTIPQFMLRNMLSLVDGVRSEPTDDGLLKMESSSAATHRGVMLAFDSLATFLRDNSAKTVSSSSSLGSDEKTSRLGIPLEIDAVEPLSPTLRYSELFPPIPHRLLGGSLKVANKVSGVIADSPIKIQIRFGRSSKWPTDIKAMGAAKTAMLIQLAEGIEKMKAHGFDGPINVTPQYMDLGYKGYSWRIVVRADPELYLLRGLHKPSREATTLLNVSECSNKVARPSVTLTNDALSFRF